MRASQERRQHRPIRSFMPFVNSDLFVSRTEAKDRLEAMPVKAPREHAMNCERVHDMRTFLFALLPLLASCADYQITAAQPRAQANVKHTLARADINRPVASNERQRKQSDADDAECRSHGVKPGYVVYLACRIIISNRRPTSEIAQAQ
jgi:hypothetical protein